jgi:hypothetical protein
MFKKSDIRNLPFDKIPSRILAIKEQNESSLLAHKQAVVDASNKRKFAALGISSEAGSDGIIEEVTESLGLDIAELTAEERSECFQTAVKDTCDSFIEAYEIDIKHTWVLPQMKSHFGAWTAVKNDEGKYCGLSTVRANCNNDFDRGLWYIAQRPRSGLIKGQGVRLYSLGEFNNLVPLILNSFKIYQNIPYSSWSRDTLNYIVDEELCESMLETVPVLGIDEVVELRNFGLRVQTGDKKGTIRSPQTTAMLYGMRTYHNTEIASLSRYSLVMLAQIWCAHPANRTQHMILDPNNWDYMPPPAVQMEIFKKPNQVLGKPNKTLASLKKAIPW